MNVVGCLVAAVICFGGALACLGQAPPNDQFANRTILAGNSLTFTGTLAGATIDPDVGEVVALYLSGLFQSVWWSWTASESLPVTVTVVEFSADTFMRDYLAVWLPRDLSFGFPTNDTPIAPVAALRLDSTVNLPTV